ncbi:RNA-binding protein 41, partial [Neophocaena asiaeorientalis asiaeorientalis]|uniref:RNA-binding protein 41 n=1 Tax=Neophocaena asiaeorientalis asiaeorientalis TaxID=1706337 RepID=A0A341BDY4_NEOAA
MKRVNSCVKSDEHVLEELETEGERQLKSLLQHQLDTSVSIEECVSKKESFAPGTMYKPFGKEAAGTMTLSQFQTLHEKDQETASLRELGLSETEILIWKSHVSGEKRARLRATPEAIQNRLRDIEERISERQRILCLPQRFAKSKQLTRREMEIENSLFQGADRHSFLKALYYQDESQKKNKGDPMNNLENFYQEMIMKKRLEEFQLMRGEPFASHSLVSATSVGDSGTAENPSLLQDKGKQAAQGKGPSLHVAKVIDNSPEQCWTGPKKLTQPIEFVPEDEIQRNRLSEEEIRKIPMFSSYNPGEPNKCQHVKCLEVITALVEQEEQLNKLKINDFSWTHRGFDIREQTATLKSGETGTPLGSQCEEPRKISCSWHGDRKSNQLEIHPDLLFNKELSS